MKIYVPYQLSLGTCVACRLDIDFVHSCHDSAIGKAFLLRTSANQTSLLALGLASVQASLMALAAPRIREIRAINFVDFCHDSAIQASLIALAAPKVRCLRKNPCHL